MAKLFDFHVQMYSKNKQRPQACVKRKMVGTSMKEEIDCGSFFDQIDDLLEFPNDVLDNIFIGKGEGCNTFLPTGGDVWSSSHVSSGDSTFSADKCKSIITTTTSDLADQLSVPYEDIVQLEWLSTFVEDSFSGGGMAIEPENSYLTKDFSRSQFHSASSPVSVLESSSTCSTGKTMPLSHEKRARSKRPRPASFNPRAAMHLMSPPSSITDNFLSLGLPNSSSESENFAESHPLKNVAKSVKVLQKKRTKAKFLLPSSMQDLSPWPAENQQANPSEAVRKCLHCEITKTPQWRAGPSGPKTLCNACGVRFKTGRLFPEYRPAASPTFVPLLHSNSHRKVLEMRSRNVAVKSEAPGPATSRG
ncbi:hypothetical protein Dimus_021231 [Dionaea muscipula]